MHRLFSFGFGTSLIAALISACSLLFVWFPDMRPRLVLSTLDGEPILYTVLTNGFVCVNSSFFGLLILLMLVFFFYQDRFRRMFRTQPRQLLIWGAITSAALIFLHRVVFQGGGWGVISAVFITLWLGTSIEQRWDTRRFLIFSSLVLLIPQVLGWGWLSVSQNHVQQAFGAHPLFNGWMTALCLMYGRQKIAGLNVSANRLIWVIVALDLIGLILDAHVLSGMGLMGTFTAWLLISGRWQPNVLWNQYRLWLIDRRVRRQRGRFRIVGDDDNDE